MSWWTYVTQTSGTDSPKEMQARTGIDGPNFSRWKGGHTPKVGMVAEFARAYGRPVLDAFVAAEFLTAAEAGQQTAAAPSLDSLSDDELLDDVRKRLRDGAPNRQAAGSAAHEGGEDATRRPATRSKSRTTKAAPAPPTLRTVVQPDGQ